VELTVRTEKIELIPTIFKDDKDGFSLIFRQPTQYDMVEMALVNEPKKILPFMCSLFVEFKNAPIVKDENGKKVEYKGLEDFLNLSGSAVTSVALDVVNKFRALQEDFTTLEKK